MGQPAGQKRAWDRDAERERKRLYRERKRAELEAPDLPTRDVDEVPERPAVSEAAPELVLDISLEEYVETIAREAAAYADAVGETDKPYKLWGDEVLVNRKSDRIERAKNYARWRYAGVLSGEVSGL